MVRTIIKIIRLIRKTKKTDNEDKPIVCLFPIAQSTLNVEMQ